MSSEPTVPLTHASVRYDVAVALDNLVALGDELCADSVSLDDHTVTFTCRTATGVVRWRGVVGRRGLDRA